MTWHLSNRLILLKHPVICVLLYVHTNVCTSIFRIGRLVTIENLLNRSQTKKSLCRCFKWSRKTRPTSYFFFSQLFSIPSLCCPRKGKPSPVRTWQNFSGSTFDLLRRMFRRFPTTSEDGQSDQLENKGKFPRTPHLQKRWDRSNP